MLTLQIIDLFLFKKVELQGLVDVVPEANMIPVFFQNRVHRIQHPVRGVAIHVDQSILCDGVGVVKVPSAVPQADGVEDAVDLLSSDYVPPIASKGAWQHKERQAYLPFVNFVWLMTSNIAEVQLRFASESLGSMTNVEFVKPVR